MTSDELASAALAALDAAAAAAVAELFEDVTEKQRRAAAPAVLAWQAPWEESDRQWYGDERAPYTEAYNTARLAVSSLTELKKDWRWSAPPPELAARVMAARRPRWTAAYADWLLIRPDGWATHFWPMVRCWVREGLIPRPDSDVYILGMINGVFVRRTRKVWYNERDPAVLAGALLEDPELLEHELWRLFEVEGTRNQQLGGLWDDVLPHLASDGHVPRGRLLEASLDALARDFAQFKAQWYSSFHEKLKPTLEERKELQGRYLALLGSRIPPTVSFALKALKLLEKAEALDHAQLVECVPPAMDARHKSTARAALWLLKRVMERSPALRAAACRAAAGGLAHPAADVQGETLGLLEAHGDRADETLGALLADLAADVSASVRPRLQQWLGDLEQAEEQPLGDTAELEARAAALDPKVARLYGVDLALDALRNGGEVTARWVPRQELPCLDERELMEPVQDLDGLLDLFAAVLESPEDPDELERLLDGLCRLCGQRPEDFDRRAGPLRKRARAIHARRGNNWLQPFDVHHDLQLCLCGLAAAWLDGELVVPRKKQARSGVEGLLVQRMVEVGRRVKKQKPAPLLAAPTHRGGWIDPAELVSRWQEYRGKPPMHDAVQSLLRLAPEGRRSARRRIKKPADEYGRALAYALGSRPRTLGKTDALWIAAARSRAPLADDKKVLATFTDRGPDSGRAASYQAEVRTRTWYSEYSKKTYTHHDLWVLPSPNQKKDTPARYPTAGLHGGRATGKAEYPPSARYLGPLTVRAAALVWPLARESYYAEGARRLANNLRWNEAEWDNRLFLDSLLHPLEPLGEMATLMLALGLCCKDPGEHALAEDAFIAAVEEGRLDGQRLGPALALLLPLVLNPTRLARSLGQCARVSPLLRIQVCRALQCCLRGEPPRGVHAALELLHELSLERGAAVDDPAARAYLEGFSGSSKAARLAHKLLALEATRRAPADLRAAAAEALQRRLERAEPIR